MRKTWLPYLKHPDQPRENIAGVFLSVMRTYQTLLTWRCRQLFLSLLLLSLCSSCTLLQLPAFPVSAEPGLAFAEQLFINGEFERALHEYQQIYETAQSPEEKNLALYGLACSQMMLARTDEQLVEAIGNLQKWDAIKGTAPFRENRHLLVLALKQQGELIKEKNKEQAAREAQQITLIDNQKKKIAQMVSTVENLQNQVKELQYQLQALEAIDENVQEIRKTL
jgi:hypothetical protein